MQIQDGSKLIFIGDSITDCGRSRPDGEGLNNALGAGYVSLVNALITASRPESRIRVINKGNSGNTVWDLANRWQEDVLAVKPDWLSIMIGINDVWRQFDMPLAVEKHVSLERYAQILEDLVVKTQPGLKGLVMCTPFYIEPNTSDRTRARMDQYSAVVRTLAAKHGAILVDTQAAFDRFTEHYHANAIAWDRVHPQLPGHMVIARAWLDAVGYTW